MKNPQELRPTAPVTQVSEKILIVEDSRTQAEALRYTLQEAGYEVAVAVNGRLALEAVADFEPQLVISDVNMPEMDGYELSRRIKANPQSRGLPIILLTTMSAPQDIIRGLECGADNFVLKPYDDHYLLDRVRHVLENRELGQPQNAGMGVNILFDGQRQFITADRMQILNLLLCAYEAANQRHQELIQSQKTLEKRSTELALANQFLDSVVENIPHMVFVKDAQELQFVRLNRAAEKLLGIPKSDLLGKGDRDFFPAEEAAHFVDMDRAALAGATSAIDEQIHTRDKGIRILHTKKLPILDELQRPSYLLGISEDITEKKEHEREILRLNEALRQRSAEADAANMAKSDFLATMSHEIRTPMNGMLGMLELLSLTSLNDEQRATLNVVRESSHSLLRIVDDILDFSKMEAGKLEICPEPCSISTELSAIANRYGAAASHKRLSIVCTVDARINPALQMDPLRVSQILSNFVSNSLKFTVRGGITITAELLGADEASQEIRFGVADTGIGISPENQALLFQPFSQGQPTRVAGGTGLGLTICRRLAQLMGGSVEMQSEPGKGTTMWLTLRLPLTQQKDLLVRRVTIVPGQEEVEAKVRRVAPSVAQAQAEGTLALLVDDHPTNRMLLLRQLNTLGYAAECVEDGAQALAKWMTGRFGIVITDCEMPEMSGYELAQNIRRLESTENTVMRRTPILACTANAMKGEFEKCISAGMDDCLVKPIDLAHLMQKLEELLPIPKQVSMELESDKPELSLIHERPPADLELIRSAWIADAEEVKLILESFVGASEIDAIALREAVSSSDPLGVTRTTHRFLGASRMVGAVPLAELCERIDFFARQGNWAEVRPSMQAFERELERLRVFTNAR